MLDLFMKTILPAILVGFITHLQNKRMTEARIEKIRAEKASIDLVSVQAVVDLWKGIVETLSSEVRELTKEVEGLRKENGLLKAEMQKLERIIQSMKQ